MNIVQQPLKLWYLSIGEGLTAQNQGITHPGYHSGYHYTHFWWFDRPHWRTSLRNPVNWWNKLDFVTHYSAEISLGSNGSAEITSCLNLGLDYRFNSSQPLNLWLNFGQVCMGSGLDLSSGPNDGSTRCSLQCHWGTCQQVCVHHLFYFAEH